MSNSTTLERRPGFDPENVSPNIHSGTGIAAVPDFYSCPPSSSISGTPVSKPAGDSDDS